MFDVGADGGCAFAVGGLTGLVELLFELLNFL